MNRSNAFDSLVTAVAREFGKDQETSLRIAKWIAGNIDDVEVESILYDHYFDDMPYGTKKARTGDPMNWISDRVSQDFKKELSAL